MREETSRNKGNVDDGDEGSGTKGSQFQYAVALPGLREDEMKPENTTMEHSSQEPKAR
jgi:hypothetical protein